MKSEHPVPDNNKLALDRTVLANERTYQAWLRTGLAALAAGLAVAKFLQDSMPLWMLLIMATILILFSILAFFLAAWRYSRLHISMAHLDVDSTPPWLVKTASMFLIGCSFLALAGVLITTHL